MEILSKRECEVWGVEANPKAASICKKKGLNVVCSSLEEANFGDELFDEKIILNKNPSLPKISIVTSFYNQTKFLERSVFSVLNQNYSNPEYIILDSTSTDGILDIIRKCENRINFLY